MGILRKYLYVNHILFILYLEGIHTLFGDELYFIWKFSSGNTVQYELNHLLTKIFLIYWSFKQKKFWDMFDDKYFPFLVTIEVIIC